MFDSLGNVLYDLVAAPRLRDRDDEGAVMTVYRELRALLGLPLLLLPLLLVLGV